MKILIKNPDSNLARIGLLIVLSCAMAGCTAPRITSPETASGTVGQPFSYRITADGRPTSFSASVPPPAGLDVDTSTGLITGTPRDAGQFSVRLGARNRHGEGTTSLTLIIRPGSGPVPGPGGGGGGRRDVAKRRELEHGGLGLLGRDFATRCAAL